MLLLENGPKNGHSKLLFAGPEKRSDLVQCLGQIFNNKVNKFFASLPS